MIDAAQPLKAGGITIWTEGDVLLLKYSAWFYGFLGTKRVPRSNITSVSWKEPGDWLAGFMVLDILGEKPPHHMPAPTCKTRTAFNTRGLTAISLPRCATGSRRGEQTRLSKGLPHLPLRMRSPSSASCVSRAS